LEPISSDLIPAAALDVGRAELRVYGLGRISRTEKVAAKQGVVKLTSLVLLPILN
jgi:hypothetical protein